MLVLGVRIGSRRVLEIGRLTFYFQNIGGGSSCRQAIYGIAPPILLRSNKSNRKAETFQVLFYNLTLHIDMKMFHINVYIVYIKYYINYYLYCM